MKIANKKLLGLFAITLLLLQARAFAQSPGCPCPALSAPNNGGQVQISAPWFITGDYTAAKNPAYFSAQVTSGPSEVPPGAYLGWCVDTTDNIGPGPASFSALFFASCDPNLNSELGPGYPSSVYVSPDVWHEINYILNHKNGAYFWNIQLAIWNLIGGPIPAEWLAGPPGFPASDQNQVLALLTAAQANAAGWQPQCGDITAIVVQIPSATARIQLLILEVPCTCPCDPTCSLAVPSPLPVCGSAGNTLSGPDGMISYQWTIVSATDPFWQITDGADKQTVTYSAGATGTATFHLTTVNSLGCQKDCEVSFGCAMSQGGCRVTGGSNKQTNTFQGPCVLTIAPSFVSHGGQVGASHAGETEFTPYSPCISGEWEHDRHLKQNSLVGVLHAAGNGSTNEFDSLLCACLPCDTTPGVLGSVGEVCNPNDRNCGPLPSKAPANKICFSGVGDYSDTSGPKTIKAIFRVDIEDRSEGNSQASAPPPDRYRIRIWLLGTTCRPFGPDSAQGLALRFAVSADGSKIANLATTEMLKLPAVAGAPDIDDGGDMIQGNHQIHPETGATCP